MPKITENSGDGYAEASENKTSLKLKSSNNQTELDNDN